MFNIRESSYEPGDIFHHEMWIGKIQLRIETWQYAQEYNASEKDERGRIIQPPLPPLYLDFL